MKTFSIRHQLSLFFVVALALANHVKAETFNVLHTFTGGSDGATPYAGVTLSGRTLYGTAFGGGTFGWGTIFSANTDGTDFTTLHEFTSNQTNTDAALPTADLVLSGIRLYGTAVGGKGTVFTLNTDGSGFTNLHIFSGSDGDMPWSGLVLSGNTLYGTTVRGGSSNGTVFAVNTDGSGFTNLHIFTGSGDGANPYAGLVLSGNTLYGTTYNGGSSGEGTVFAVGIDGGGYKVLYSFTATASARPFPFSSPQTNGDGALPNGGLLVSGSMLYGAASEGGRYGYGTLFKVNTNGSSFTTVYTFTGGNDGANPLARLVVAGNTLLGTAAGGGAWGSGTVFALNVDGTGFTTLHHFTGAYPEAYVNGDGVGPYAGLVLSGSSLYGTAYQGGGWSHGTIFSMSLLPRIEIGLYEGNAVVSWPTSYVGSDYSGYILQTATNLVQDASVSPHYRHSREGRGLGWHGQDIPLGV